MIDVRSISKDQWFKEGVALFGKNLSDWKFVCPICGNVASIREFEQAGASRDSAYQECIGRYVGGRSAMIEVGQTPCDYAAYGLIGVCTTVVMADDGTTVAVFEFAAPEGRVTG